MRQIMETQKRIEEARHELNEAFLRRDETSSYYEKSVRLDKLIEEYLERTGQLSALA